MICPRVDCAEEMRDMGIVLNTDGERVRLCPDCETAVEVPEAEQPVRRWWGWWRG